MSETVRGSAGSLALAVTSSTGVMSLALGRLVAGAMPTDVTQIEIANDRRHAEEFGPRLRELLAKAEAEVDDLGLLVVDVGPGRFTGLRVGLASVRALAFALDVPVVPVTSLETLARGIAVRSRIAGRSPGAEGEGPEVVTASIDARRQEVFQQVFVDGEPKGPPIVDRPELAVAEAAGVVAGDGLDRYHEVYQAEAEAGSLVLQMEAHPCAADMLAIAANRSPVAGTDIVPVYLREPDAVANIRTRPEVAS